MLPKEKKVKAIAAKRKAMTSKRRDYKKFLFFKQLTNFFFHFDFTDVIVLFIYKKKKNTFYYTISSFDQLLVIDIDYKLLIAYVSFQHKLITRHSVPRTALTATFHCPEIEIFFLNMCFRQLNAVKPNVKLAKRTGRSYGI